MNEKQLMKRNTSYGCRVNKSFLVKWS